MTGYSNDRKLAQLFIYKAIKTLSRKISAIFSIQYSIDITETQLSVIKLFFKANLMKLLISKSINSLFKVFNKSALCLVS